MPLDFRTAMNTVPTRTKLLPIESPEAESPQRADEPIFEPSAEEIMNERITEFEARLRTEHGDG